MFHLVTDRSHCQDVLELAESLLGVAEFLVQGARILHAPILLAGGDHILAFDLLFTHQPRPVFKVAEAALL